MDFVLDIQCPTELDDIVQARLFLTASTGNVVNDDGVTAYFATAADRDHAAGVLRDLDVSVHARDAATSDWLELYEQSLKPIFIGRSFVIAPDARLIADVANRHRLVIPQEQAFGTGSHETTSLCIELLESLELRGKTGLDIGSGSGILGLAMCRLGARHVIAFDNDLDAYAALRDNRQRNDGDAMSIFIGAIEALRGGAFDVITMNILPDVIVPLLPRVRAHMRDALIVSGILVSRREEVLRTARDLTLADERTKGEWWAATFRK